MRAAVTPPTLRADSLQAAGPRQQGRHLFTPQTQIPTIPHRVRSIRQFWTPKACLTDEYFIMRDTMLTPFRNSCQQSCGPTTTSTSSSESGPRLLSTSIGNPATQCSLRSRAGAYSRSSSATSTSTTDTSTTVHEMHQRRRIKTACEHTAPIQACKSRGWLHQRVLAQIISCNTTY